MNCKKCGKKLSPEDECFLGYCENCYSEEYGNENSNNEESNSSTNMIAKIIKTIAIIEIICVVITGLVLFGESIIIGISIILGGIVSGIFVFALGEIIQLLEDIKNK